MDDAYAHAMQVQLCKLNTWVLHLLCATIPIVALQGYNLGLASVIHTTRGIEWHGRAPHRGQGHPVFAASKIPTLLIPTFPIERHYG